MTESDPIICIYKITSPSGKIYIGQTGDYKKRLNSYRGMQCKKQAKLYWSFLKYGFKEHVFKIVKTCTKIELNHFECFYINMYNTFNTKMGLNLRSGGHNSKMSDSTKKKLSEGRKGDKHHHYGKKFSDEWKNKIRLGNTGKVKTKEQLQRMSAALKGRKMPPHFSILISKRFKGKTGALCFNSTPISQYTKNGVLLMQWKCSMDVNRQLGINHRNVMSVCRGERNIAGGFVWRYKDDSFDKHTVYKPGDLKMKIVVMYDLDGKPIKRFSSLREAAIKLNRDTSCISRWCKNGIDTKGEYRWGFLKTKRDCNPKVCM